MNVSVTNPPLDPDFKYEPPDLPEEANNTDTTYKFARSFRELMEISEKESGIIPPKLPEDHDYKYYDEGNVSYY